MRALVVELRFAVRKIVKTPGYALAFVVTLGLGIGANTAVFSLINGVVLKPLPHCSGDQLVYLRQSAQLAGVENALFSVPEIVDLRERTTSLSAVTEHSTLTFTLLGLDDPRLVRSGIVTGNYFTVMGLQPVLGRAIDDRDDGEGAAAVMMLTYDFWGRVFGFDPAVVGRTYLRTVEQKWTAERRVTRPEGGGKPDRSSGPPSIPKVFCGTRKGCIEWSSMRRCGAASMWRG